MGEEVTRESIDAAVDSAMKKGAELVKPIVAATVLGTMALGAAFEVFESMRTSFEKGRRR